MRTRRLVWLTRLAEAADRTLRSCAELVSNMVTANTLLLAAVHALAFVSRGLNLSQDKPKNMLFDRQKGCTRAYPPKMTNGTLLSCWYLCKGLPVRYDLEENRSVCFTDSWETGECNSIKCIKTVPLTGASLTTRTTMTKISFPRNQGQTTPSRGRRKQKCTRATKRAGSVRKSCRYRCLGRPVKFEMEVDGTPCRPSPRRRGFCFHGRCQKKYPETNPPQGPNTLTPDQERSVQPLNCSYHKKKTTNDGALRTCSFICKTEKVHVLVIEEKGTPCVGSWGKRGICIGRICRALPWVATWSAASGNWSKTRKSRAKTTPVVFSIEYSFPYKPNGTPSLYVTVNSSIVDAKRSRNYFTEGGNSVYRSGSTTQLERSSESPTVLRKDSTQTKTRLHSMIAASKSAGTSVSPDLQVHLSTREKTLFEHQSSDIDGGLAVSATESTPEIVANEGAYTHMREYAGKSTMVSVTKATSTQGALKFEAKATSIEPYRGETQLESSDSFKSMLKTAPSTTRQSLMKSDIEDEQRIDRKADFGTPERASENLVLSLMSKGYYTTPTVHASSERTSTTCSVFSQVPHLSREVNNHTRTTFSHRAARESSNVDMARTHITESLNVQTSPVHEHAATAAEARHIIAAARTIADTVINSKGSSDTFLAKPRTQISTTGERREMTPKNLFPVETPLGYHTEATPEATSPMLITPGFVRTSTAAFRGTDFAHKHEAETTHKNASPIAVRERFRRISTAFVDQTRSMGHSTTAITPVTTTFDGEVDVSFVTDIKLAAREGFVAPSMQETSGYGNRLSDLEAANKAREPLIIFTDFLQKFATRSMTNGTTLPARNNIGPFGT